MEKSPDLKWYVVHTYSGHENKVKLSLERIVESRDMQDVIPEVRVPMEEVVELKDGQYKKKMRKIFPGYVIICMEMNDESWYVVRNTKGVTGFVGPGSKPVPLSDEELRNMGIHEQGPVIDFKLGDMVSIKAGPFIDSVGTVGTINEDKNSVIVLISMFGRDTPVELEYHQVVKL